MFTPFERFYVSHDIRFFPRLNEFYYLLHQSWIDGTVFHPHNCARRPGYQRDGVLIRFLTPELRSCFWLQDETISCSTLWFMSAEERVGDVVYIVETLPARP